MAADADPARGAGDSSTHAADDAAGGPVTTVEYDIWIDDVLPQSGLGRQMIAAAFLSGGLFAIELVVAALAGRTGWFLDDPTFGIGAIGVFILLILVGRWASPYVEMWNGLSGCFDCDPAAYFATIDGLLSRFYDNSVIAATFLLYTGPYNFIAIGPSSLVRSPVKQGLLLLNNVVIHFLGATMIVLFLTHIALIHAVMRYPLANPFTAADDLEPITHRSTFSALVWFLGVSLLVLYLRLSGSSIDGEILPTVGFTKAWIDVIVLLFLVLVGVALLCVPMLQLHAKLAAEKRALLNDIDAQINRLVTDSTSGDGDLESVNDEVEALERLHDSASRIRTWSYEIGMIPKIVATTILPLLELLRQLPWV